MVYLRECTGAYVMLSTVFGVAGIGLGIAGGLESMGAEKNVAKTEAEIVGYEKQAESQRRQAMELSAQRSSLEVTRNAQRARSMALENATTQGAQFGSGLQGGYGSISGQSGTNLLGISQNLQIGRNIFDINAEISDARITEAKYKGQEAEGAGLMSLGKSVLGLGSLPLFGGGK